MNGLDRIGAKFDEVKSQGRAALMPYFTLGYPTRELSLEIIRRLAASGADLIELGIPFSDPLADGPTIQRSTQIALEQGISVAGCLESVAQLRAAGVQQPLLLMGYYNPILAFDPLRFVTQAAEAGADGFIIPDLPPEEAGELEAACRTAGCALIYLLAPSSTADRIAKIAQHASGFIYLVSVDGITGARHHLPADLEAFIRRVRAQTNLPLAVGFGISTPSQAAAVARIADGVIVGSALIQAAERTSQPAEAVGDFVRGMHNRISAGEIKLQALFSSGGL